MLPSLSPSPDVCDATTSTVDAEDPNSMYGPAGYGAANFVADSDSMFPYLITFENAPSATAPAQEVSITDQLDSDLNWNTFQLKGINWGNTYLAIPAGSQDFETMVPMTYEGATFDVEVEAGIHTSTGQVYATFQSIDPSTGLPPSNPLIGFLPPEDGTGRGEGSLSFTILPDANLATGTQIRNVADITFDQGLAIATDQVNDEDPSEGVDPTKQALVTIDSGPPTSDVTALPAFESSSFTLDWSGQDDAGGSGVASYDIFVSEDGGSYTPFLTDVPATETSATFTGTPGNTYAFYSIATDNVGNVQPTSAAPQATTEIALIPTVVATDASGTYNGNSLTASATATGPGDVTVSGGFAFTYYVGSTATGQGTSTAPTIAGTYTVVAAFTSSDLDYSDTESAPVTFTIGQATPVVTVIDAGGVYQGNPYPATATIAGVVSGVDNTPGSSLEGVPLVLTYYTGANTAGTPLSGAPSTAGSYTVAASFAGSQDYEIASKQTSFVISQATPSVVASDAGGTYDGNSFSASATAMGVGNVSVSGTFEFTYYVGSSASGQGSSTAPTNAGSYTVVADFTSDDPNYANTDSAPVTFTISPATPAVVVSDAGGTYDGNSFAASGTATGVGGATVSGSFGFSYYVGSTDTGTATTTAPTNAGTYTVVAAFTSSNSNYVNGLTDSAPVTFTIEQVTPKVIATDAGGTYNRSPFTASATATGVGGATVSGTFAFTYYVGTSASGTGTSTAPTNVGTYTVVAAFTSTNANYVTGPTDSAPVTFTISAATGPTISAPSAPTVNEDAFLVFSTANGNAISVADPQAGSGIEQLTLTTQHGLLTLASTKGITLGSSGVTGASGFSITIKGALASLNAAINGLKFTPTAGYAGPASLAISYKDLGDSQAASATVAITVDIPASQPTVAIKTLFPMVVPGEPVPLVVEVSDTNATAQAAPFTFAISFGDGDSATFRSNSPLIVNHVYTKAGTFTVRVTATDEFGHTSAVATMTLKVVPAAVETDPFNSGQTALFVGTSGGASVAFTPSGKSIAVTLDGANEGTFTTTGPLIVFGQGGKDTIKAAGLKNPLYLLESPTADNVETDMDDESIRWAGLTAAVEILNA